MNGLEQFTKENRAEFDVHTPSPELWNAIKPAVVRRKQLPQWAKYAAAAVIVFAIGFGTGQMDFTNENSINVGKYAHSQEDKELIENEYYYMTQINEKMGELQPYFVSDPRLKKDIDIDFEDLDRYCKELKNDLQDNVNNEFVIEALIQSYETKLSILEGLLNELKPEENETEHHEI